jgi:uroporphyrinogen-III synthase
MAGLNGLSILVSESRELDLFANMLEEEGARAIRCPLVQIADLPDTSEAEAWISRIIGAPFHYTVLLTGEGLRRLLAISRVCGQDLIAALHKTRLVTRGPKPVRALREINLTPSLMAPVPTSQGVLEVLEKEPIQGVSIGVQLYPGDGALWLTEALRQRGAQVYAVTPYRYASDTESGQVAAVIGELAAGRIGMIAFTSSSQIERLYAVAAEFGLEQQLSDGLARIPIAAVGPVMEEALAAHGLKSSIHPNANFHLKPLVRAIVDAWRDK